MFAHSQNVSEIANSPSLAVHVWLAIFLAWSLTVPPALVVVVLRLLTADHFQWSNPVYQAIENRSLWHVRFWEWIGSIAVFLFLLGAAVFLRENGRDQTTT
jgi:hypothetical protein